MLEIHYGVQPAAAEKRHNNIDVQHNTRRRRWTANQNYKLESLLAQLRVMDQEYKVVW